MTLVAFDPSLNNTGYCVWSDGYVQSGVLRTRGDSVPEKLYSLARRVNDLMEDVVSNNGNTEVYVIVETPDSFSFGRATSRWTGRGMNQAALHKLNRAIGVIESCSFAWGPAVVDVVEVSVSMWKGRRKKKLDKAVASQVAGRPLKSSDEADAVLLANYAEPLVRAKRRKK